MTSDDAEKSTPDQRQLSAIVLAAGRGTRMKSRMPKVLHPILGRSMLDHVLAAAAEAIVGEIVVVSDPVSAKQIDEVASVSLAVQPLPLGTADAVAVGIEALSASSGSVLILNGDVPLVRAASLTRLAAHHWSTNATLTLGSFHTAGDAKYGRIEHEDGKIRRVREAADDGYDRTHGFEANGGIYCCEYGWLKANAGKVRVSRAGEYYITSLVEMAARGGDAAAKVESVEFEECELLGVDDKARLAQAEAILRQRIVDGLLAAGVTIVDPARTVIESDVQIHADARIEPGCFLRGRTSIDEGSVIGPYSIIENSSIGRECSILQSWVCGSIVGDRVRVGPFSRLRPDTLVESDVFIGNFVETKATAIGAGSDVHHVTYLGDAILGSNVNVGAGTITCNYDGVEKHRTIIGDDVFVGCDTMLVAPVELGAGSKTGAGAVVTRSVPPGRTVVGVPARDLRETQRAKLQEEHGR